MQVGPTTDGICAACDCYAGDRCLTCRRCGGCHGGAGFCEHGLEAELRGREPEPAETELEAGK